jgi:hypothetical protein
MEWTRWQQLAGGDGHMVFKRREEDTRPHGEVTGIVEWPRADEAKRRGAVETRSKDGFFRKSTSGRRVVAMQASKGGRVLCSLQVDRLAFCEAGPSHAITTAPVAAALLPPLRFWDPLNPHPPLPVFFLKASSIFWTR